MDLLPIEQRAKEFVSSIGIPRATRLLELLCSRIERRIRIANAQCFGQFFDEGCIKKAPWEVDLIFELKMGLSLNNTDTPAAAKTRITARRKAQREAAAKRRLEATSA